MESNGDPIDLFRLSARWKKTGKPIKEPKPSHLNTLNSSGLFQMVSLDKMSVQYVGSQQHGHGVGAVQADWPAPTKTIAYYFEMTVKNSGEKGQIAIGFTHPEYNLRRQPGWGANSCGYHGDDGYIYHGHGKGDSFGPTYTAGDTVGAGINYASQEFFFTKNGRLVGTVDKDIKGPLYPTIAVHSQNEEVTVNFGKQPFLFDIKSLKSEERLKQQQLIRNGDIDAAFHKLREWYPQVVQDDHLLEAVSYARTELKQFLKVEPFKDMLEDAIVLLAYDDPSKSCVGYLLKQNQREYVADAVNAIILLTNPNMNGTENCMFSCLESY